MITASRFRERTNEYFCGHTSHKTYKYTFKQVCEYFVRFWRILWVTTGCVCIRYHDTDMSSIYDTLWYSFVVRHSSPSNMPLWGNFWKGCRLTKAKFFDNSTFLSWPKSIQNTRWNGCNYTYDHSVSVNLSAQPRILKIQTLISSFSSLHLNGRK